MKRLTMVVKAGDIAIETIRDNATLKDSVYKKLKKLPERQALKWLAREFLERGAHQLGDSPC